MIVCMATRARKARETGSKETPGEPWRPLHAYRCYLHGPDGIHALQPHGPGAQRRYLSPAPRSTNSPRVGRPAGMAGSGAVRIERTRNVLDPWSAGLRPGDRDEVESKRAAHPGVRPHPGRRGPTDASPLRPCDGLRRRLWTGSTGLDLHEHHLAPAGTDQVDLVSARPPVSREDPIAGSTQQASREVLSPAPQGFALRERTRCVVDPSSSVPLNRAATMGWANQPGINARASEDVWNGRGGAEEAEPRPTGRSTDPPPPARPGRSIPPPR